MKSSTCLSSPGCGASALLLDWVTRLREALADMERSLRESHLQCCVLPEVAGAEEIVDALTQLSAKRIGALIAVEQDMDLSDYAKTGVAINADLTAALLVNLFYPGSPLHDGAVVVRRKRIVAGGCILPLSADHELFRTLGLGTRHRAAVGLSLVSDAIVFVVSEQSGAIRVVSEGKMFHEQLLEDPNSSRKLFRGHAHGTEESVSSPTNEKRDSEWNSPTAIL
jgi:diadenylate cyclase